MKRISFAALALNVLIVSIPQKVRQPSAGIAKKESGADTQLAADSHDKQQATETAALNAILAAITKSEQESARERQQEASDEKETIKAEWWLVYVGIAQAIALISTLCVIWYQARKTAEATEAMRDSLPLQKSSADAALLNAQAAVAAARPWISFFGMYSSSGVFTFKAANFGNTPAEVVSYASGLMLIDRVENLPSPPSYGTDQVPIHSMRAECVFGVTGREEFHRWAVPKNIIGTLSSQPPNPHSMSFGSYLYNSQIFPLP